MKQTVRVLLTDIFDLKAPTAMDQRMEYAFGADGQDFWERFFPCNKAHLNKKMVYLFTEHQMWVLYNWWAAKYESSSEIIRRNLDFSRQNFFYNLMLRPYRIYADLIRVCFVRRGNGNKLELSRVFFGVPPEFIKKKDYINFFYGYGKFKETPPSAFNENERESILTELLAIRPAIEKEFGGPRKNDTKWLCYLGARNFKKDHSSIEYCGDLSACPFAEIGNSLLTA